MQKKEYTVSVRHNGVKSLLPEDHTLAKHYELMEKHSTEELRQIYREMVSFHAGWTFSELTAVRCFDQLMDKIFKATVRVARHGDEHSFTVTPRVRV